LRPALLVVSLEGWKNYLPYLKSSLADEVFLKKRKKAFKSLVKERPLIKTIEFFCGA